MTQQKELQDKTTMTLISFFLGSLGIHRLMMGYSNWWLMLITAGGCGIWTLIDFIQILTGKMGMADGRPLKSWEYFKRIFENTSTDSAILATSLDLDIGLGRICIHDSLQTARITFISATLYLHFNKWNEVLGLWFHNSFVIPCTRRYRQCILDAEVNFHIFPKSVTLHCLRLC